MRNFEDIARTLILNTYLYFQNNKYREEILERYIDTDDEEIVAIMKRIKKKGLQIFNYDFDKEYNRLTEKVYYDRENNNHYILYNGKKMYGKKRFSATQTLRCWRKIKREQDKRCPHSYQNYIQDKTYDVVIDAGCAEGSFILDSIDKAKKAIAFECDSEWEDALSNTLNQFNNVKLISKYLSREKDDTSVSLDSLFHDGILEAVDNCLIKMDIEGFEPDAIIGGQEYINCCGNVRIIAACYHHSDEAKELENLLKKLGFQVEKSVGYMWFPHYYEQGLLKYEPQKYNGAELRKALIIADKVN